jgi:hypothetical protein
MLIAEIAVHRIVSSHPVTLRVRATHLSDTEVRHLRSGGCRCLDHRHHHQSQPDLLHVGSNNRPLLFQRPLFSRRSLSERAAIRVSLPTRINDSRGIRNAHVDPLNECEAAKSRLCPTRGFQST